jgi:hypothetical protein
MGQFDLCTGLKPRFEASAESHGLRPASKDDDRHDHGRFNYRDHDGRIDGNCHDPLRRWWRLSRASLNLTTRESYSGAEQRVMLRCRGHAPVLQLAAIRRNLNCQNRQGRDTDG